MSLSRREEQVLLAVWSLKEDAYLLSIKHFLDKITDMSWSIGSVQKPLLQLERKRYISTFMGEATAVRGGRRKKICRITPEGVEALKTLKREQETLWGEFLKLNRI